MGMNNASHFCAGIKFSRRNDGKYEILGVVKKRYPRDVCLPGGTNENAPWENPEQTFVREFSEETGLTPITFRLIHSEGSPEHMKNFFVVLSAGGQFNGPKIVKEPDGDELTISLWDLAEFGRHLFRNHEPAFLKACAVLAKADASFVGNYPEICRKIEAFGF